LPPDTLAFYLDALGVLEATRVPFLVGGAYALAHYTGVVRHTKDFDVFVRPDDAKRLLAALARGGYRTDLTFPHWLGKAFLEDDFVDVIFSSGNGICRVDDEWFDHAEEAEILGVPVRLVPPEEMIWSKGFVQERERFDGADIAHVIRSCGPGLDWAHMLRRFGPHWRILFGHLIQFGFVYPGERDKIPGWIMEELGSRLHREIGNPLPGVRVCQGTLLSREQYLPDIEEWGYADARLEPSGAMSPAEIARWTEAIHKK